MKASLERGRSGLCNLTATKAQGPNGSLSIVHSDFRSPPMAIIEAGTQRFDGLRDRIRGPAVPAAAPRCAEARRAWTMAHEQHPAAVVYPLDANDVVEIVNFARSA